ncbi:SgcJ/EcaC family oxidoreductase [Actinomadura fibrosa]|uniref:SgcJ/EcaC family oxidoreductase n=1 Tax=Actinomadura fibrosa TaxID=111802 RepID=A0ABW2XE58_9ACTN|nr:SgcJ/EcaC family oxidoreductase [Actinomadura fibrosa]
MQQDVRAVFDGVSEAWRAGDVDEFAAAYSEDATATLPGFHLRGRENIRAAMADAFAGPLKGTRRVHEVQSTRHLDDDTVIAITRSGTARADEEQPETWSMVTWVLRRSAGRWQVEAYHDCPAA